ncbi:hypothetical protein RDWZM_003171 [Blomia tropicalis]|uniref:Mitochondrial carnitine/acylcarnitine carrier protein n=1 Tax=Blomia tropicalis TaxID=40697 RepID=A0A9Q0MER5_BLOTA|nr:hypothetical protein BLOT_000746 [Blomia tropicalis]KAJ6224626.1 hypothetical protein RDWZM_003171 [Blomia tropicalis]
MVDAQISTTKNFFAGGFGGICLVAAGHPLDTVKVRLQTMSRPNNGQLPLYNGTFDCIGKIFSKEGMKGFYKGMATPLVGVTPMYAITFFGYSLGKKLQTPTVNGEYSHIQIYNAGMLSAIFTTPLNGPGERIKCLLQVQAANPNQSIQYRGPIDAVTKLYRTGGLRSVGRGTFATLIRDVPANGVYFMSYEMLKVKFRPKGQSDDEINPLGTFMAGGIAGMLFWVVGIPPDVIKSRLQTAPDGRYPNGIRDVFGEIIKQEGLRGLYKGATAVFLRAFPANAACFLGYELAMKFLHWLSSNQ